MAWLSHFLIERLIRLAANLWLISTRTFLHYSLAIVFGFSIIAFPAFAHAGAFSFLGELFGQRAEASVRQEAGVGNSQTIELLRPARNPNPNPSKGGGDITIVGGVALLPESGPAGTTADIVEGNPHGSISLYVVREGDTLSQIAKMFSVSVNTIAWANNLKSGIIRPGETLVILPISGVRHTVVRGDTLASIAKKYKADTREVALFNNLSDSAALTAGETIIIPDGELAAPSLAMVRPARGIAGPDYGEYYMRPILGGRRTQGLHGYNGIDLANYYGAPILASAEGQVLVARDTGWNGGYGKYVVIAHPNGTQTLYAHLASVAVYPGKLIVRGEVIGTLGSTGNSTGPHLHFEIRGAKNPF